MDDAFPWVYPTAGGVLPRENQVGRRALEASLVEPVSFLSPVKDMTGDPSGSVWDESSESHETELEDSSGGSV